MAAAREGGGAGRALRRPQCSSARQSRARRRSAGSGWTSHKRSASCSTGNPAGEPGSRQGKNERGVDCELRSSPQRQTDGNDLNAPVVLPDWVDVEVADST